MRQILLQNARTILSQNVTEVCYKMRQVFYYKMRQLYYKVQQLLQNAWFITNCDSRVNVIQMWGQNTFINNLLVKLEEFVKMVSIKIFT